MNEENFNDPLSDLNPIMDSAFSINESSDSTESSTNDIIEPTIDDAALNMDNQNELPLDNKTEVTTNDTTEPTIDDAALNIDNPKELPLDKKTEVSTKNPERPSKNDQKKQTSTETSSDDFFNNDTSFDIDESLFEEPATNKDTAVSVSKVTFKDTPNNIQATENYDKSLFQNIKVDVSIELGRSSISLKKLYELKNGSIIELSRLVGEPLDLVIKDQVIARGEVVAVNNNYGIRLTHIESLIPIT
jgi:flagellar motor switch protein FliN